MELTGHILSGCTKPYPQRTWTKAFGINALRLSSRGGRSTADGRLNQVKLGDENVRTGNGNIVRMKRRSKTGLIDCSNSMDAPSNQAKQRWTGSFCGNEIQLTGQTVERPGSRGRRVLPAPAYSMTLRPRKRPHLSHLHAVWTRQLLKATFFGHSAPPPTKGPTRGEQVGPDRGLGAEGINAQPCRTGSMSGRHTSPVGRCMRRLTISEGPSALS